MSVRTVPCHVDYTTRMGGSEGIYHNVGNRDGQHQATYRKGRSDDIYTNDRNVKSCKHDYHDIADFVKSLLWFTRSNKRGSLLHYFAMNNKASALNLLLLYGANPDEVCGALETPLITAIHYRSWESVETLVRHRANLDHITRDQKTILSAVASAGLIWLVRILVDHGAQYKCFNGGREGGAGTGC